MDTSKPHKESRALMKEKYPLWVNDYMIVHHINGNPFDNRPSNLIPLTRSQHYKIHGNMGGWKSFPQKGKHRTTSEKIAVLESLISLYNIGWFIDVC